MGRRLGILAGLWAVGVALAGCSGSGNDDTATGASQETVTVTVPASKEKAKSKAEEEGSVTKVTPTSESDAGSKGSAGAAPPGEVQATNDSPPEVTLAVIDAESASVKKRRVRRYAVLLDDLERACTEARAELAELALTASNSTKGMQVRLSILDVLKAVAAANPSGVCADAFTRVAH